MIREEEYDDGYRPEDFDDPDTELIIDFYPYEPTEDDIPLLFCEECGLTAPRARLGDQHCDRTLTVYAYVTLDTDEERALFNYDTKETA